MRADGDAGCLRPQGLGVAAAARCCQNCVDAQLLARRQGQRYVSVVVLQARFWILAPMKHDSAKRHRDLECRGNLVVEKRKQRLAAVDYVNLRAERRERTRVLSAD